MQVVHPARRLDLRARCILIDVKDRDVLPPLRERNVLAAARAGAEDQRHRAHLPKLAAALVVGAHDALCELWVQGALHPRSVALVIAFDVVEGRLAAAARIGGCLRTGPWERRDGE